MRARARKTGHALVVELGGSFSRDMALAAVSAEPILVRLVLLVAVITGMLADLVAALSMAGAASELPVLALEAEPRMGKVSGPGGVEAQDRRMATAALPAELASVLVLVTIHAIALAGTVDSAGVTARTLGASLQLFVKTEQRKTGVPVVIERLAALAAFDMASRAWLVRKLISVRVAMLVTARARSLAIGELAARLMAAAAA